MHTEILPSFLFGLCWEVPIWNLYSVIEYLDLNVNFLCCSGASSSFLSPLRRGSIIPSFFVIKLKLGQQIPHGFHALMQANGKDAGIWGPGLHYCPPWMTVAHLGMFKHRLHIILYQLSVCCSSMAICSVRCSRGKISFPFFCLFSSNSLRYRNNAQRWFDLISCHCCCKSIVLILSNAG